jgi:putative DNA primase/helicase
VRLVRGVPGVLIEHTELDQRHELLNVLNGTIDLRTGKLLDHNPEHLITKQLQLSYDPTATCPTWDRCLCEWQPDEATRAYLQRKAGASATGYSPEEFDIHWGNGGNGKGKFFGTLMFILGDYAMVPHKSLVVVQRHEQHETVMADLFGVRLAVAAETRPEDRLDEEKIKELTGGDRLRGRRMREDPWRFDPTHCLVLHTNHKPIIRGTDEGIWRRVNLVPWTQSFLDAPDVQLPEKLKAEAPGILNWIIEGARQWLAAGRSFAVPQPVQMASSAYRLTANPVHAFLLYATVKDANLWSATDSLHDAYLAWRAADELHDETPAYITKADFGKEMTRRGYQPDRRTISGEKVRGYRGIGITPAWVQYAYELRACCPQRFEPPLSIVNKL